jgi:hypothetical protein
MPGTSYLEDRGDFMKRMKEGYQEVLAAPEGTNGADKNEKFRPFIQWYMECWDAYLNNLVGKGHTGKIVAHAAEKLNSLV